MRQLTLLFGTKKNKPTFIIWGETIINTMRFIVCYSNPVLTAMTALLFLMFSGENTDGVKTAAENIDTVAVAYALSAVLFGSLAIWVFSIGALIVLGQLVYGSVKYFTVEENKAIYLHYFYGFAIAIFSYTIIFTASTST